MNPATNMAFGVVILAAGASRRMGRPKMLLPWGGTSVIGHSIQQWQRLGAFQIGVVCGARDEEIPKELDRLRFSSAPRIFNPEPERGMFSSIRCAAAWPGWSTGIGRWVISLGDQPQARPETLRTLLDFAAARPGKVCQPLRKGRRRHPVVLSKAAFTALNNCTCSDFKQFLDSRTNESAGFESEDGGLDFDIDTPDDYERARQFYFTQDSENRAESQS